MMRRRFPRSQCSYMAELSAAEQTGPGSRTYRAGMSETLALHLADSCAAAAAVELQALRSEMNELLPLLSGAERGRIEHALNHAEATSHGLFTSLRSLLPSH